MGWIICHFCKCCVICRYTTVVLLRWTKVPMVAAAHITYRVEMWKCGSRRHSITALAFLKPKPKPCSNISLNANEVMSALSIQSWWELPYRAQLSKGGRTGNFAIIFMATSRAYLAVKTDSTCIEDFNSAKIYNNFATISTSEIVHISLPLLCFVFCTWFWPIRTKNKISDPRPQFLSWPCWSIRNQFHSNLLHRPLAM